jgi:hypothetical protein
MTSDVPTVLLLRIQAFWDMTLCHQVSGYQRFERPWHLCLQGQTVREEVFLDCSTLQKTWTLKSYPSLRVT